MITFKDNNQILFIPGWLDLGLRLGYKNSLNVWFRRKIDIQQDFKVKYIIAHSVGSLVALYNWQLHKNCKLILVNPVIFQKNLFIRWLKFIRLEGLPDSFKQSLRIWLVIPSFIRLFKLFKIPSLNIIQTIPKNDLVIVYGENDRYLCNQEIFADLKKRGYRIEEVKKSGHNYDKNIEDTILNIMSANTVV